jgi:dihydrofolate reductase
MGRMIVFIAASLDGFIARKDDDISWLDPFSTGPGDYGYAEFMKTVGIAIMGARTYEQSLLHPERLLTGVTNYVLSHRTLPEAGGTDTEFWHGPFADLVTKIRHESKKDVYLVGGGQVISQFLNEGLVDEVRQFIVPVILTEGIPLYTGLNRETALKVIDTETYPSGVVKIRYSPEQRPRK